MSISGARNVDDIDDAAWKRLAAHAGYRPAFVTTTVSQLLERARHEATALLDAPKHQNDAARTIADRIRSLG